MVATNCGAALDSTAHSRLDAFDGNHAWLVSATAGTALIG
jgi:hypothetical protein